jgi:hypothetical protein
MFRKTSALTSISKVQLSELTQFVRSMHSSTPAAACHSGPTSEQMAIENQLQLKRLKQNHDREVLVCKLGSLFARLEKVAPEVIQVNLTQAEQATLKKLKIHHLAHRREEHALLIEKTVEELQLVQNEISELVTQRTMVKNRVQPNLPYLTKADVAELVAIQYTAIDKENAVLDKQKDRIQNKLSYLRKMDTKSEDFLIDREYLSENSVKFKN